MGKSQRTKGAVFEREVAAQFSLAFGKTFKRNIGQARDGGNDIDVGPLVVECKRRKTLTTIQKWMEQANAAALGRHPTGIPVVVARADNEPFPLVIVRLADFIDLIEPEMRTRLSV